MSYEPNSPITKGANQTPFPLAPEPRLRSILNQLRQISENYQVNVGQVHEKVSQICQYPPAGIGKDNNAVPPS